MLPYLALFSLPGAFAVAGVRRSKVLFIALALIYWLAIGFRLKVGMDWNNYLSQYLATKDLSPADFVFQTEVGFKLLMWFAGQVGGGILFVNAVSGLIFCWGFFSVARRCREPMLAVVVATPLLVIAFAMSGTRQALALGVIFYLYATWERRSTFARVALVLLASLFHFSAIFVLIFVALAAHTTVVIRTAMAMGIALLIGTVTYLQPESMESYSRLYMGTARLEAPGALTHVTVLAAAAAAYLLYRTYWVRVNGDNRLYHHLAVAGLASLPAVYVSSAGTYRFTLYLWPMAMYVWAGMPGLIQTGAGRMFYRLVIVSVSGALLVGWLTFANSSRAWVPYQNWLLQDHAGRLRQ